MPKAWKGVAATGQGYGSIDHRVDVCDHTEGAPLRQEGHEEATDAADDGAPNELRAERRA
eukprot:scaffold76427_cov57-Phaeocystis_antarctica.AAC.4